MYIQDFGKGVEDPGNCTKVPRIRMHALDIYFHKKKGEGGGRVVTPPPLFMYKQHNNLDLINTMNIFSHLHDPIVFLKIIQTK